MTIENAKHISEVMKAYSEGRIIEYRRKGTAEAWSVVTENSEMNFDKFAYRERPRYFVKEYKDEKEFLEAMKAHGPMLLYREKNNTYDTYVMPVTIRGSWIGFKNNVVADSSVINDEYTLKELVTKFVWQDGSSCGKIIKE